VFLTECLDVFVDILYFIKEKIWDGGVFSVSYKKGLLNWYIYVPAHDIWAFLASKVY